MQNIVRTRWSNLNSSLNRAEIEVKRKKIIFFLKKAANFFGEEKTEMMSSAPDIADILDKSRELDRLRKEQEDVLLEINKMHKKLHNSMSS